MAAAASLGKMPPWKMSSFSTSRKMENFGQCPTSMIVCKMNCRQRYWWFLTTDGETLANWQNLNGFCWQMIWGTILANRPKSKADFYCGCAENYKCNTDRCRSCRGAFGQGPPVGWMKYMG